MKLRFGLGLLLLFLALPAAAQDASLLQIDLKPQQQITIVCHGDTLIVSPANDNEMQITCRVWVDNAD